MSDGFNLSWPPKRLSLGNFQLRLDPQIRAEIDALRLSGPSPRLRSMILSPSWNLFQQSHLSWMLSQASPAPRQPIVPRGRHEGPPRAAEVGDLAKAVWAIPAVQQTAGRVLDEVSGTLRRGWSRSSTAQRALIISHTAVIAGAAITATMANRQARTGLLDFVSGRDIPVPGVEGLSLQLRHNSAVGDYGGIVSFDLAPYLP